MSNNATLQLLHEIKTLRELTEQDIARRQKRRNFHKRIGVFIMVLSLGITAVGAAFGVERILILGFLAFFGSTIASVLLLPE